MAGVVTMVSARIAPDRAHEITGPFAEAVRVGMPERRHTALLRGDDDVWRIMTFWRDRADLDAYLAAAAEPFALRVFRAAGGTPSVEVFDLVADSTAPFWP